MTSLSLQPNLSNSVPPKRGLPVTIITGFLGSGKTTLLNHILQNRQGLKVAVLVNEFGDINIDSQLLVTIDTDMLELSNGCICCTINEGLVEAVYRVLEREEPVDYLVIETTGIADPLPIMFTFIGSELRDLTRLDSVITVVDAETFTPEHFDSEAALQQITYGDIILLNKVDLVSAAQVDAVEAQIREIKTGARILRTQHGEVPLPLILDVGFFQADADLINSASTATESAQAHEHHQHKHEHEHQHHHSDHLANDGFMAVSFQSDRPFSVQKFQQFLDDLPEAIFRAKGVIWFKESNLRHIFQLSGKRCDLQTDRWPQSPQTQLVFIGRHLDTNQLLQQLAHCLADPETSPTPLPTITK